MTTPTIRSELTRLANILAAPRFSGSNKIRNALLAGLWAADGDDAPATAAELSRSIFSLLKSPRPPEVEAVEGELQLLGDIFAEGMMLATDSPANAEVVRRLRQALGIKPEERSPGEDLIAQLQAGAPALTFADVAQVGKTYEYAGEGGTRVKVEMTSSDGQVWGHVHVLAGNGRVMTARTPAVDGSGPASDWKLVEDGGAS